MTEQRAFRRWTALGVIILFGVTLRFWRLGDLALIGDESYYWLWSHHLDWAYFDHPAGVSIMTWLSTALGGQSEMGIRWLNALLGAGTIALCYAVGAALVSHQAGLLAAFAVAVGAPFLLISRFVYTDALHLFLLLLNLLLFWRLASEQPRPQLSTALAFGLSLGLLFNTKYSAYLYAIALALAVLMDHRHLLTKVRFWLAALIAGLGLVPVVAWNAAHDWASYRWQLSHASFSLTGEVSLLGTAYHNLTYLTWPLLVMALLGLGRIRRPAERLLVLVALLLLLPVALSPANSPRNLSSGLVTLLVLAGTRWPAVLRDRRRSWMAALLVLLLATTATYGLGTVANLSSPGPWPSSNAVADIRQDATGWRELGPELSTWPEPLFALDYSIASQIRYYSHSPAYTSWGQYRIWGIPGSSDWTIVSLAYLPQEPITARLHEAFQNVKGPRPLVYEDQDAIKTTYVWRTEGLLLDQETFLREFDFLNLLADTR
jgi:4-amino-4-deoxy-L-arabinose transferase-like glycosyltransferase